MSQKPIVVDTQRSGLLSNGLVDLNRDLLMKIIEIIPDEVKIRNIIGMTELFYSWSKQRIFRIFRWKADPRISLHVVVWCPTQWGDEVCIIRGTDVQTSVPCFHTGKECWWSGSLVLTPNNKAFLGLSTQVVEMSFHIIKRRPDGTIDWEIGPEHPVNVIILNGRPKVTMVCAFRDFERPRDRGNWPIPYGPGFFAQRASGGGFIKTSAQANSLFVEVLTRANYHQPYLRLVGDIPELGVWDVTKALPLMYSFVTKRYEGRVDWDTVLGPRSFTYKVVFVELLPPIYPGQQPTRVIWESGENHTCFISSKPSLTILDIWGINLEGR